MRDNLPVAIPQHFIEDLLARTDIVEVIGQYVPLKKKGADFWGLCPFHSEKTASFSVSASKQFYHCFGCGQSGNAIGFLMAHTGADFVEVVHDLARHQGLTVPDDGNRPQDREAARAVQERRSTLAEVLARAATAYSQHLKDTPVAIAYLKSRGVTGRTARQFGLGWAPDGWHALAGAFADYQDPLLEEAGLVVLQEEDRDRRYDRFRGRLMFPIRNTRGQVIAFGGRALGDGKPKYLNSPETPLFHKGRELYGLFEARKDAHDQREILVVEGYMDVIMLAQHGLPNTVATLGTACTAEHVQKLVRVADTIIFSFDGDAAGRRAAAKALQVALPFATDKRAIRFLFLPAEHDPDSFVRTQGPAAFRQQMAAATPLSEFLLEVAAADCDMDAAEGRARFAAQAGPLWQQLPDGVLARQLLGEIAVRVQISADELEALWRAQVKRPAPPGRPQSRRPPGPGATAHASARAGSPRRTPPARAQRAVQIILTAPELWLGLSSSDQQLLYDLPAPWGPLLLWLDGQMHEHGVRPWAALREALRGHPHEAAAVEAVEKVPAHISSDPAELQAILQQERPHHLKRRMNEALAASDLALYRALLQEFTAASTTPR